VSFRFSIIIIFASVGIYCQGMDWRWSNPLPHGNNINVVIHSVKLGLYVQLADKGQIYSSTDRLTWTRRESNTQQSIRSACFLGDRLVFCGETGLVGFGDSPTNIITKTLNTSDWLEGMAARGSNLVVAVGDNGAVHTSTDGIQWTRRPQSFNTWLRSVVFGVTNFVAVGEDGFVAVSTDGVSWTPRSSGTSQHLNRVFFNGVQFWALGDAGVVLRSTGGTTWFPEESGTTNDLVAAAFRTNEFVVGGEKELRLRSSTNWFSQLPPTHPNPAPVWTYLSGLWDGTTYAFGGRSGVWIEGARETNNIMDWKEPVSSPRPWLWDIGWMGDKYVAVGDRAFVMTSSDGVNWESELVPRAATNSVLLGVSGRSNAIVAVGTQGRVILSTNGYDWSTPGKVTAEDLHGVFADEKMFIAVGSGGTILTSVDAGHNWDSPRSGSMDYLSGVCSFSGKYIVVGRSGTILTSADGIDWTRRISGTTNWLYRVEVALGKIVAAGQNGTILTSSDGVQWAKQNSGTDKWLNGIADNPSGSECVAVGVAGTILRSSDLVHWEASRPITGKPLYGVASHSGQLIAVGVDGSILRANSGAAALPLKFENFSRTSVGNLFLISGATGLEVEIHESANLIEWDVRSKHLIEDPQGTLIILDLDAESKPAHFFRAKSRFP